MIREIVDHEIVEDTLIVTLDDGSRWIARDFVGIPTATEAWKDIDESNYSFEAAAENYDFEPLID